MDLYSDYESGSTKVLTLKSTLNPDQSSSTTLLEIGLFDEGLKKKHFPGHCLGTGTKYLLRLKSRIFLVTLSLYYVIVVLRFKLNKNIHIQKTKNL